MLIAPAIALSVAAVRPEAFAPPPARPLALGRATVTDTSPGPRVPAADAASAAPSASGPTPSASANQVPAAVPAPSAADPAPPPDDLASPAPPSERDPLEGFNRVSFRVSMAIDKAVIRPAALAYRHVVPKPLRDGAHNALSNLGEPLVFLNDMLQLKPARAGRTLMRFLVNSVLGLGGVFDVARHKPFFLPHHANSMGDTLGFYGVKPGPYIYVPLLGPTTLRDAVGSAEGLIPPALIHDPLRRRSYRIATTVVGGLDQRERADGDLKALLGSAVDPYATLRSTWLQARAAEIAGLKAPDALDPRPPAAAPALDDPLIDPGAYPGR